MEFDYIVVGAGAAGSVLASRLSQDPSCRVLLIEYGGRGVNPMLRIPKGFYFTLNNPRYTYRYPTKPVGPGGQTEYWTRGKVLGGSTAVNGMMWTRGAPADWDGLAARGNPGWDWPTALAAYRGMENHSLGASASRGGDGPLGVSVVENDDEVVQAILAAAERHGWPQVADTNDSDGERIGFTPSTIRHGLRTTAYSAFVHPVRKRTNLTVVTGAQVGYLMFDGTRVVGVQARHGQRQVEYRARAEVVLSAGTVETTLLLERSGIGRADVLRAAGVEVVVESPNVGERVIEQRGVNLQMRLNRQIGPTQQLNTAPKQAWEGLKYLLTRRGPVATGGYDLLCQFKSTPELDRPDIQGIWVPLALDTSSPTMRLAKHSGVMFLGYQIRPSTRSSVHLSGGRPADPPVIDSRYLESEPDRVATASILAAGRAVFAQSPLADYILDEEFPGAAVTTPDEVVRYSLDTGAGLYHAVGANAMGPADDDVVDARLRVRGVSGLRIADASVLPVQVAGNSAAPTMAVGWIAADLIRDGG